MGDEKQAIRVQALAKDSALWDRVADYAAQSPWSAGETLAKDMRARNFLDWERVLVAMDEAGNLAGYATFTAKDCIPDGPYSPYIGFVFVAEAYRGNRISEKMLRAAMAYAKELGYKAVYVASGHEGLYEKFGFVEIDRLLSQYGEMETIFKHDIARE